MRALVLGTLLATPTLADTSPAERPLTGAEFQAHVGQNTISYVYSSGTRGTADYGPDRTLVWAFDGDACFPAQWFEDGDQICFAYLDGRLSACWHMFLDGDRLYGAATFLASNSRLDLEIREVSHTDQAFSCPGPDVGV